AGRPGTWLSRGAPSTSEGTKGKNQRSTITRGTDRKRPTYPAAKSDTARADDSRITASTVPQAIPATTATAVIPSDTFIPCQRNGSAPGMELQSKSYIYLRLPRYPGTRARDSTARMSSWIAALTRRYSTVTARNDSYACAV